MDDQLGQGMPPDKDPLNMVATQKSTKTGRQVAYHRTSSDDVLNQLQCSDDSFSRVFVDQQISRDASRPELREMLSYLQEHDSVVVESFHCLGYCFSDLQSVITMILEKGCSVKIRDENLTFSPQENGEGQSLLRFLGAIVRTERPMLSEVMSMKAVVSDDQPSVRSTSAATVGQTEPESFSSNARATVTSQEASKLRQMKKAGVPIGTIQREFNLSRGAINRILISA